MTVDLSSFSEDELDDLSMAIDAATGEGAAGYELAPFVAAEYKLRELLIPLPWSERLMDPDAWLKKQLG